MGYTLGLFLVQRTKPLCHPKVVSLLKSYFPHGDFGTSDILLKLVYLIFQLGFFFEQEFVFVVKFTERVFGLF